MWVPCLTPIYSWFEGYLPTSCPSHGGFQMTPVMFRLFFFLRILGPVVLYSWSLRGSVPGQYLALIARLLPGFEIWSVILYLIHSHDIHWCTVIFYHSDKDTDPHSVVNIDQLTAICEMLLVTTLSFVWGHEINNMISAFTAPHK